MRRREYLASVSVGCLLTGIAGATGAASRSLERASPSSEEISVQPGTTVLFETDVGGDVDPRSVDWYVDDEPHEEATFWLDYVNFAGNPATSPTFDSSGTYEVRADGSEGSTSWTIEVDDEGASPPVLEELSTQPAETETMAATDPIEIAATASDPEGELDRVLWQEGRNQVDIFSDDVSGDRDTATLEFDEPPLWIEAGYPTHAVAVTEGGRVSEIESVDGPVVRPPMEVAIADTNAPVRAGERLEVTVEVENSGSMMGAGDDTQEIELVVGGERVDAETVTVMGGTTETVSLGYETYPVERDVEFDVAVVSPDFSDEVAVEVIADGAPVSIAIVDANDPVNAGEFLEVTARLENGGSGDVTEDVDLVVGGEHVDAATATVPGGGSQTVTLGYETYPVGRDVEFDVTASASDDTDQRTVRVVGTN